MKNSWTKYIKENVRSHTRIANAKCRRYKIQNGRTRLGASTEQKYSSTSTIPEKMTSTSTSTSTGFSKVLEYKYKYFEKYLSTSTEYFRCKL